MSTAFLVAIAADLTIGDPKWLPHPIRWLGWLAAKLEAVLWRNSRFAGVVLWFSVVGLACVVAFVTLPWLAAYWIWSCLALRNLDQECSAVIAYLNRGDIEQARLQLATIVGRDTVTLDEPGIVRAVIETMSENLNDAVIAPLFYLALAGPVAMAAYKAINTLDSMVGYKSERYRNFGWFSARMDDVAGFVPARLSAALVWGAALLLRYNASESVRITLRDASSQPSPNSGYPEAAFAGALGIRLGGESTYGGTTSFKAPLGDPSRPLDATVVREARRLLYLSSAMMMVSVWVVLQWR